MTGTIFGIIEYNSKTELIDLKVRNINGDIEINNEIDNVLLYLKKLDYLQEYFNWDSMDFTIDIEDNNSTYQFFPRINYDTKLNSILKKYGFKIKQKYDTILGKIINDHYFRIYKFVH